MTKKTFSTDPTFDLRDMPSYATVENMISKARSHLDSILGNRRRTILEKYKALRDFIALTFICRYGRRIGEVEIIELGWVDLERNTISFRLLKKKDDKHFHTLPILPELTPYLTRYVDLERGIFGKLETETLIGLTTRQIRNVMYEFTWLYIYDRGYLCPRCKARFDFESAQRQNLKCITCTVGDKVQFLKKRSLRPHAFRHSVATHLLNLLGDIEAVKRWLGHVSILTTSAYTHYSLDDLTRKIPFFQVDNHPKPDPRDLPDKRR